jgi:hypothetical protein
MINMVLFVNFKIVCDIIFARYPMTGKIKTTDMKVNWYVY